MPKSKTLEKRFVPQFWERLDGRMIVAREIRQRYERLRDDVGCDSAQKEMLVQRAVFIALQLESMECDAADKGKFDMGVYTQMVNALSGLLSKLGLEKQRSKELDLESYLSRKK